MQQREEGKGQYDLFEITPGFSHKKVKETLLLGLIQQKKETSA